MVHLRFVFGYWIAIALLAGCSIDNHSGDSSTLIFKLPETTHHKAGAFAGFQSDGCFAVNIVGDKIPIHSAGNCDASYGVFAGLVANGGTIELTAPYGKNRTIEIYYVEVPGGCGKFDAASGLGHTYGTNKVHRIGLSAGHNFDKPVVEVPVNIDYPKGANTIGTLLKLPTSCELETTPTTIMAASPASLVHGAAQGTTADGSKIFVRIVNQNLDLNNTTGSTARVRPIRLGESQ